MALHKAPDGSIHDDMDGTALHLLPDGSVQITDEEAEEMLPKPPVVDPKDVIRAQIKELESEQLMPRATREFMLMFMEANASADILAVNPGYQAVKAFDNQIKALRAQL